MKVRIIFFFSLGLLPYVCFSMDQLPKSILKKVDQLLAHNAELLHKSINKENQGIPSPVLYEAQDVLNIFFNHSGISHIVNSYPAHVIHIAQLVAERSNDRERLMSALYSYDLEKTINVLQENPDVKNAHKDFQIDFSYYDRRFLPPLSQAVMQDNWYAISFLLGCDGICINSQAVSILSLAQSKRALKLLFLRGITRAIPESERSAVIERTLQRSHRYKYETADYIVKSFAKDSSYGIFKINIRKYVQELLYESIKYDRDPDCIEFLLDHGADPFQKNSHGKLPIRALIKKDKNELFHVCKAKNILFIPFRVCNIIQLLQKNVEELHFLLHLSSDKSNRRALTNLFAELFMVLKNYKPVDSVHEQKIMLLSDGWCFNNASLRDLEKICSKETIIYIDKCLEGLAATGLLELKGHPDIGPFLKEFKKRVAKYPFILRYSPQETFKLWHPFVHKGEDNLFSFLMYGPDLGAYAWDNSTLLHNAIFPKNIKGIQFLAQENNMLLQKHNHFGSPIEALIKLKDPLLLNIFLHACLARYTQSKVFISPNTAHKPSLYADYLYRNQVRKMLKEIKNPNVLMVQDEKDKEYIPLLHLLVKRNVVDLCEILLKNGAYIHKEDSNNKTPLWYAVRYYQGPQIIMLLLSYKPYLDHDVIKECIDPHMKSFLYKESQRMSYID